MDTSSQPPVSFNPPPSSQLPEEFRNPKPRPLPDSVQQSAAAMRRRNAIFGCLISGFLCMGLSTLGFMHTLALYILPLGYLLWFGLALGVLGVAAYLVPREYRKACRYIEEGDAAFARVTDLKKTPVSIHEGQILTYGLVASVEIADPETGEVVERQLKSRDFSSSSKDKVRCAFRVGDYVPAVWLPNQFGKTLQLYDFVEITPEHALIFEEETTTLLQVVLTVLGVVGVFFVIFWSIYAIGRYAPIDFEFQQGVIPLTIGAVLGIASFIGWHFYQQRIGRKITERNAEARAAGEAVEVEQKRRAGWFLTLILSLGSAFIGCLAVLSWCYTVNALLDRSPAKVEPVNITGMVQVTHKFIFREYKLKFRRPNDLKDHELMTTPEHLDTFIVPAANARIRAGWLGWPWVESVDPAPPPPQN
jgi:hypothetical protein